MLTVVVMLGILVLALLGSGLTLWLCARLVRAGAPSFRRALACSVLLAILGVAQQMALMSMQGDSAVQLLVLAATGLALTWLLVARVFHITFLRSMLLSLPYSALSIPAALGLIYVIKGHVVEAFIIPTNSMAPILYGWHHEATCPNCQGRSIISARPPDEGPDPFGPPLPHPKAGICTVCRKINEFKAWPDEVHRPVRFICNKLIQPRRGDAIVFVYPRPRDPDQRILYVQRLIGLPGEKIEIKESAVWINGQKWDRPAELDGFDYFPEPGFPPSEFAPKERAWELGPDEYFVLGDFSTNSSDSRDWGPVPQANLVGVASLIYWPPSALRILR